MTTRTETIIDSKGASHFVTFETHGYRVRIWGNREGYLGSYTKPNRRAATVGRVSYMGDNGVDRYENTARGPLDAARQLIEFFHA